MQQIKFTVQTGTVANKIFSNNQSLTVYQPQNMSGFQKSALMDLENQNNTNWFLAPKLGQARVAQTQEQSSQTVADMLEQWKAGEYDWRVALNGGRVNTSNKSSNPFLVPIATDLVNGFVEKMPNQSEDDRPAQYKSLRQAAFTNGNSNPLFNSPLRDTNNDSEQGRMKKELRHEGLSGANGMCACGCGGNIHRHGSRGGVPLGSAELFIIDDFGQDLSGYDEDGFLSHGGHVFQSAATVDPGGVVDINKLHIPLGSSSDEEETEGDSYYATSGFDATSMGDDLISEHLNSVAVMMKLNNLRIQHYTGNIISATNQTIFDEIKTEFGLSTDEELMEELELTDKNLGIIRAGDVINMSSGYTANDLADDIAKYLLPSNKIPTDSSGNLLFTFSELHGEAVNDEAGVNGVLDELAGEFGIGSTNLDDEAGTFTNINVDVSPFESRTEYRNFVEAHKLTLEYEEAVADGDQDAVTQIFEEFTYRTGLKASLESVLEDGEVLGSEIDTVEDYLENYIDYQLYAESLDKIANEVMNREKALNATNDVDSAGNNLSTGAAELEDAREAWLRSLDGYEDKNIHIITSLGNSAAEDIDQNGSSENYLTRRFETNVNLDVGAVTGFDGGLINIGDNRYSSYTDTPDGIDVWADGNSPGGQVGTSFAAPRVAMVVTQLKQLYPNASAEEIKEMLIDGSGFDLTIGSADDVGGVLEAFNYFTLPFLQGGSNGGGQSNTVFDTSNPWLDHAVNIYDY
ncbi:MAG: S8/S53 family peptidase [Cyanobacteria bacterium P01_H01_bin.74]